MKSSESGITPNTKHYNIAALVLCLLGAVPRVVEFLRGHNLWSDEAILAWHLVVKRTGQLAEPLSDAMAPPLFLVLSDLSIGLYGTNVYALRLLPLVAGVAVLPLVYLLARNMAGPRAGLAALAFSAFTLPLITYSNEVRPYTIDAALCLALLLIAWPVRERPLSWKRAAALGSIGGIAIWLSFPSVFVLCAIGAVFVIMHIHRARMDWIRLTLVFACWAYAGVTLLIRFILPARSDAGTMSVMNDYYHYAGAFMPFPPASPREWSWFPRVFWGYIDSPLGLASERLGVWFGAMAGAVIVFGISVLLVRHWRIAAWILIPIVLALIASGLELYPFYQRTVLWTAPLVFIVMGLAFDALFTRQPRSKQIIVCAIFAALIAVPAYRAARATAAPSAHHELNRALEHVRENWQKDDRVFLPHDSYASFKFTPWARYFTEAWKGSPEDIRQSDETGRVWIVSFYDRRANMQPLLDAADDRGEQIDAFHPAGASAYLYEFDEPDDKP